MIRNEWAANRLLRRSRKRPVSRIFTPAVATASGADRSLTPPAPSSGGNTVQRLYKALVSTIRLTITRAQQNLPRFPRALLVASFCMSTVVAAAALSREAAAAQAEFVPAQDTASLLGGGRAQGAVIWSHGR